MHCKLKIPIIIIIIISILFVLLFMIKIPHTPMFRDDNGKVIPESIASLEKVTLGGIEQTILIRGKDKSNPLLLFLHSGPGMPAMFLAHCFQRDLEKDFVVIHWDQRGAGKSFHKNIPVETMNVEQILSDTFELIQLLRDRFGKKKIFLIGHSWGSYLGMIISFRYPESLHAFISMGQVVNGKKSPAIKERFIRENASKAGDPEVIEEIKNKGSSVYEKYLFLYGGELNGETSWMPLLKAGFQAPEYSISDILNVGKASSWSSDHMIYNAILSELDECITELQIPVYFFTGRHDYCTPFELIEDYYVKLKAPKKEIVWFENSAHFPFFEEPELFYEEMIKVLQSTFTE